MGEAIRRFHCDEDGATATEYVLLLIMIACFAILAVKTFGQTLSSKFQMADEVIVKEVEF